MREKKSKSNSQDLKQILIKKATGYDTTEIIEEYVSGEEGEIKLVKKKVTRKNVPPDLSALKILMDNDNIKVEQMTDEQLLNEKLRLLEELKKMK